MNVKWYYWVVAVILSFAVPLVGIPVFLFLLYRRFGCKSDDNVNGNSNGNSNSNVNKDLSEKTGSEDYDWIESSNVGNIVQFGKYNGKEIDWIILEKKKGKVFMMAKNALDMRSDKTFLEGRGWVESELRKWLNKDFYREAFNEAEKLLILSFNNAFFAPNIEETFYSRMYENIIKEVDSEDSNLSSEEKAKLQEIFHKDAYDSSLSDFVEYGKDRIGLTIFDLDNMAADIKNCSLRDGTICSWWGLSFGEDERLHLQVLNVDGELFVDATEENKSHGVRPVMWVMAKGTGIKTLFTQLIELGLQEGEQRKES